MIQSGFIVSTEEVEVSRVFPQLVGKAHNSIRLSSNDVRRTMTLSLLSFLLLLHETFGADQKIAFWRSRKRSPQKKYPNAQMAEEIATVEETPRTQVEDRTLNGAINTLLSLEFSMRGSIISLSLDFSMPMPIIEPPTITPASSPSSIDGTVVSTNHVGGIIVSARDAFMPYGRSTLT